MPLYEYCCVDCQHHFDVRHSANERPELHCPCCNGDVKKVFLATGIIFKGNGWHIKDYASKDTASTKESDTASYTSSEKATPTPAVAAE